MDTVCAANTQFTFDLLREVNKDNAVDNVFMSSLSIFAALAMVHLGAKGNTASQMEKTLHLENIADVDSQFQALLSDLNSPNNEFALRVTNGLFGEKSYTFLPTFLNSVKSFYYANLELLDFATAYEEARQYINSWVEEHTEGKIKELLKEGAVSSTTKLVLVNAMYFKANWTHPFRTEDTSEQPFSMSKSEQKSVQMMHQENYFNIAHVEEPDMHILELPYGDKEELSMYVLLPTSINDDTTGLEQLEQGLSYEKFEEWISTDNMERKRVQVYLPRFRMDNSFGLNQKLSNLGMSDAFSSQKANFSGMSDSGNLVISEAVHSSFVAVNETGTEAAAATGIVMVPTSIIVPDTVFKADHPFHVAIMHKQSKCILFYGRVSSP